VYSTVKGINWDIGAIGNNRYKGIPIKDLLLASGFTESDMQKFTGKHLVATGIDADF